MSDALALPARPNLERYKKLAKELREVCRSPAPHAAVDWISRWSEGLAERQGVKLTAEERERLRREAERIEASWRKTTRKPPGAGCTLSEAQFLMARAHGFSSWPIFAKHVEGLAMRNSGAAKFEAAVEAIVEGDGETLARLLEENPGLIRERSNREHRSTLLHYVAANGVEDFRQRTPKNIVAIARMLLEAGADVNAESEAYGGGTTALLLAATSIHPARAGVQTALLELLLERGAYIDKPGGAGRRQNAVSECLANGQRAAAEFLARRGGRMGFAETAGVGDMKALRRYFDEDGKLSKEVSRREEQSGFLYACGYGREEAAAFLLERGMSAGMENEEGETGLHWAAYGGHAGVARMLLEKGAAVEARERRFGGTPLDWALHGWLEARSAEERERGYEMAELLAGAGARFEPARWRDGTAKQEMLKRMRSDERMQAALGMKKG
ncbi:MAG TPA: ankyrin repeat domain-containing protein [Candidatus Acidoferrales bacterium]|nr:ankyrin repeat domain-containing protein [Candidatus Acidoferrales bacterium]